MAGPYIRLLADHEAALADLYASFANHLSGSSDFWNKMADDERKHQALIEDIRIKLEDGTWRFKRPDFVANAIIESLNWVEDLKKGFAIRGLSMRDALQTALQLEKSMIEHRFFDVFESDSTVSIVVMEAEAAGTRAHIHRLELEAKRFKWRIMGRKKVYPRYEAKPLSRAELQASLKGAQADMLGRLVSLEEAIARLYVIFAEKQHAYSEFWSHIAAEEVQHSTMLKQLYKVLEKGKVFGNVDRFNEQTLDREIKAVLKAEFEASNGLYSPRDCALIALKIEKSLSEDGFYSTVTSDSEEFRIVAERLNVWNHEHVERIEAEVKRIVENDTSSPQLRQARVADRILLNRFGRGK